MVTHILLQWTELHLRPLKGVFVTCPVLPVNAVRLGGRAVMVPPVQAGVATVLVPPGALVECGTRPSIHAVIIAVLGGELRPGMDFQTVTWNDTVLHTR
jgi:hypothetical protein